ncbi:E3 ubiquitin-protein ligase RNF31-like isoform X2 [Hemiscyllium ocellatum]|uniref:E3 ubiquitin-protein ligase RNF31-like isoform X2 n=1 Tax=Hemiscyllium ocellatum TaxID=170820 RepID=UPI00296615E7|nr:E3 ubiquitin-protein ligase RNF31-like isoform X2 [Hemiscyllium ocellatum]
MPALGEDEQLVLRERAVLALTTGQPQLLTAVLWELVQTPYALESRYRELDVTGLLRENLAPNDGLITISRALNILEKYGRNLLSESKPKFWRAVKFNNPVFKTTVDGIKGGRSILRLYGYTVEHSDGMSFPDDVHEPDHQKVSAVTLEVAMLQMEIDLWQKGSHPHPELFSPFLPGSAFPAQGGLRLETVERPLALGVYREPVPSGGAPAAAGAVPLGDSCAICSKDEVAIHCQDCGRLLCRDCDALYHRHPSRGGHQRVPLLGAGGNAAPLPASEELSRASPGAVGPPLGSLWAAVPGCTPPPVAGDREEVSGRPGLAWRSLSTEQPSGVTAPRPDRRLSELGTSACPRGPWACASCGLVNEARAVLCGACERPRASPAPAASFSSPTPAASREGWACRACTFQNEACAVLCSACDRPRLAGRPSFVVATTTNSGLQQGHPPPPSQQQGWQCQFCTYLNVTPGRICEMCDRTNATLAGHGQGQAGVSPRAEQHGPEEPVGVGESLAAGGAGVLADHARQEEMRAAGLRLVQMIRMGEEQLVSPEEVCCALRSSGTEEPLAWLQTELPQMLDSIADLASQKGHTMAQDQVGPVSRDEARQAWLHAAGDFEEAVGECVRSRARKFREICAMGFSDQQEVLQALYMNRGDVDKAVIDLQRQLLEPFHTHIWQEDEVPIQLDHPNRERTLRQMLATYNLPSWGRAEIVLSLMQEGRDHYQLHDVVEAVKESQDKEFIKKSMLSLTCLVCLSLFPRSKMQSVTSCECTVCRDCFKSYFTFTVREKHIKNLVCPGCSKPDINDEAQLLSYFSTLDVQLRDCLDADVYNLFHKKLTERTLMKDPNFKWCTHCSNGFIYDGNQSKVTCPQCKGSFCSECRRPWEPQHQGISCEDFQNWKRENDPEYQAQGLAAYLKENGIDCPNCKFRYALAKGGCMHFKCSQCQHEFCSGCYNTFLNKKKCTDPVCRLKETLHAHHPRDCLSYLRDWPVNKLQTLLQRNKVAFDTDPPIGAEPTPGGRCRVMEQREVGDSLTDAPCGAEAQDGHAGLCESHYKEYLVSRINSHSLDPAELFSEEELQRHLARCGRGQPPRASGEDEAAYRNRLYQAITSIPLGDKIPRVRK